MFKSITGCKRDITTTAILVAASIVSWFVLDGSVRNLMCAWFVVMAGYGIGISGTPVTMIATALAVLFSFAAYVIQDSFIQNVTVAVVMLHYSRLWITHEGLDMVSLVCSLVGLILIAF